MSIKIIMRERERLCTKINEYTSWDCRREMKQNHNRERERESSGIVEDFSLRSWLTANHTCQLK